MVFCNKELEMLKASKQAVTILILIDGFLQFSNVIDVIDVIESQSLF